MRTVLSSLAKQYEIADFINGDPSWFMHQVSGEQNQETMAFIASCFSYGSRKQFMPKIQALLDHSGGDVFDWVKSGRYRDIIPEDDCCFYRLYTNRMVLDLLDRLASCCNDVGGLKALMKRGALLLP